LIGYAMVAFEERPDDTFEVTRGIAEVVTLVVTGSRRSHGVGRAFWPPPSASRPGAIRHCEGRGHQRERAGPGLLRGLRIFGRRAGSVPPPE